MSAGTFTCRGGCSKPGCPVCVATERVHDETLRDISARDWNWPSAAIAQELLAARTRIAKLKTERDDEKRAHAKTTVALMRATALRSRLDDLSGEMCAETREGSPSCCEATTERWMERLDSAIEGSET